MDRTAEHLAGALRMMAEAERAPKTSPNVPTIGRIHLYCAVAAYVKSYREPWPDETVPRGRDDRLVHELERHGLYVADLTEAAAAILEDAGAHEDDEDNWCVRWRIEQGQLVGSVHAKGT